MTLYIILMTGEALCITDVTKYGYSIESDKIFVYERNGLKNFINKEYIKFAGTDKDSWEKLREDVR